MEYPVHVLKTNDADLMPVSRGKLHSILRTATIILIAGILLVSLLLNENIFMALSSHSKICLTFLALFTLCEKKINVPSPVEISFFDDYLVVHHPKQFLNRRCTRKVIEKIRYSDITSCKYRTRYKQIVIMGAVDIMWYDYGKDGTLPTAPSYHKLETKA